MTQSSHFSISASDFSSTFHETKGSEINAKKSENTFQSRLKTLQHSGLPFVLEQASAQDCDLIQANRWTGLLHLHQQITVSIFLKEPKQIQNNEQ